MIKADVLITNKNWKKYIRSPGTYINRKLKKINNKTSLFKKKDCNFSLLLADAAEVKKLNIKFRKKIKQQIFYLFLFMKKKFEEVIKEKN